MSKLLRLWPIAVFLLGMASVTCRLIYLGVPGEFEYKYVDLPNWDLFGLVATAIPAAGIVAILVVIIQKRKDLERREVVLCLVVLTLCSLIFHVACSILLNPFGTAGALYHVLQIYGDGAYLLRAVRIDSVFQYLGGLEGELATADIEMFPHPSVHPPGFVLVLYALRKLVDWNAPGVDFLAVSMLARSPILNLMFTDSVRLNWVYPSTGCLAACAFWCSAAALPLAAYPLARQFLGKRTSLLAAGLCALLPGTHLFNPTTDQFLPLAGTVVIYLGVLAVLERRMSLALAFGIAAGIALNLSLAMSVCVGVCLAFALLRQYVFRSPEEPSEEQPGTPSSVALGLRAVTGFAAVVAVCYSVFGMNLIRVSLLCLRNNGKFNEIVDRSYLPCLVAQPFETAYSLGILLFCLLLWVVAFQARGLMRRVFPPDHAFLWSVVGILTVLAVTGINRGEVGRLWLFLYPSLTVAMLVGLSRNNGSGSESERIDVPFGLSDFSPEFPWAIILGCQVLQTMVLCLLLDPMMSIAGLSGG